MAEYAYHISAREALIIITMAMAEAKALLPRALTQAHWVSGHHSPAAWRSVEAAYVSRNDADPTLSAILTDLKNMSEAVAALSSVLKTSEQAPLKEGWQKLAPVRRTP